MPDALARNTTIQNPSLEKSGGQQFSSTELTTRKRPRSEKPGRTSQVGIPNTLDDVTFLRLPEVKAITGLSKSSLYGLIREKSFPSPVRLGPRAVAWIRSEVRQWAAERVRASRPAA
ncbi:MAG: AlpA family transcriptional regulator [Terracidiphilus sp.]|jgi:prophage regulatory protein